MSRETFQIAYDGKAVRDGSMDVYALAPALLSLGDLIKDANRLLNQDQTKISVQVESDFKRSSFDVSLLIDQTLVEHAKQILFGGHLDASAIIDLLFGTKRLETGVISGALSLFGLYKLLKGEKPKKVVVNGDVTIVNGDVHVVSTTARLYGHDAIREHVDGILKPLGKDGIDKFSVAREKSTLEEMGKDDLPCHLLPSGEHDTQEVLSDMREAIVRVSTANFENGKWRFTDGNAKFGAKITDPTFLEKLDSREEGFYKGDVLRVKLRTIQTSEVNGKLRTEYEIAEVLDHEHLPNQAPLLAKSKN